MSTITYKQKDIIQEISEAVKFKYDEAEYSQLTWQEASKVITALKHLESSYLQYLSGIIRPEHTKKRLRALSVPLIKELGLPLPSVDSFYKLSHEQMNQVVHKLYIQKHLRDLKSLIR